MEEGIKVFWKVMYDEFLLLLLITFSDSSLFLYLKQLFFVYFKLLMAFPQPAVSCSTMSQLKHESAELCHPPQT
jgi:hypothetical protein